MKLQIVGLITSLRSNHGAQRRLEWKKKQLIKILAFLRTLIILNKIFYFLGSLTVIVRL